MARPISSEALQDLLAGDAPMALLDVREPAAYNAAHIPGATSLPRRLIEFRALRLVPYPGTLVALCDDDGRRAAFAAETLEHMGYLDVRVLDGGLNRWAMDGLPTEWGVNVPSKDFGERLLEVDRIPEVSPDELQAWMQEGKPLLLLDARTPEEHASATIPGSRSMPGGELALRVPALLDRPDLTVVVHCAGRTRSIIGAGTLQRMGLANVYCLRNGTMGWVLAGLELEHGSDRLALPTPSPEAMRDAEAHVHRLAEQDGVEWLSPEGLKGVKARSESENVYLVDIRTRAEYLQGHIPGFQWYPGGQAVQTADELVGVRQGHVVFACDGVIRAGLTAAWFRRMGYPHVYAVEGGTKAWSDAGGVVESGEQPRLPWGYESAREAAHPVDANALQRSLQSSQPPLVLYVGTSRQFSEGHPPGAVWLSRSWLELRIGVHAQDKETAIVTACPDGIASSLAAATLQAMGYRHVAVLDGGMRAWREAGLPGERGLTGVVSPPNDVLAAGTERTPAEMIQYLRWEEELGMKYRPGAE